MDTVRVDICYRPLRIGWAISSTDKPAFRSAVRMSHALWGGRFNPILVVEQEEEASRIVDLFRLDMILPLGDAEILKEFPKRFAHLITPFLLDKVFIKQRGEPTSRCQLLDIHNALVHLRNTPEWKTIKEKGVHIWRWQADDSLADILLMQLGAYPRENEIGIDYHTLLTRAADATESLVDPALPIQADIFNALTVSYLSRYGLHRHYSVRAGWDWPGFFVGDVTDLDDLVCHWNLRAADIPLWFIDPNHISRYADIIPTWKKMMRETTAHRDESERQLAIWSRRENIHEAHKLFGSDPLTICKVSSDSWNGGNVRPPMMHFDQVSTLGVIGEELGKPKISFALNNKPFCSDVWFHTQHLVASISFIGGLYGDEHHTLNPPYIPELNEFYARTMHFEYDKLRVESGRIALLIDAADTDTFLHAMPVADLIEKVFGMGGFSVKLSSSGLIARQLIKRVGGLYGAAVFKIPGVRRLLKTHGPTAAFTKKSALQLIGGKDPANADARSEDQFGRKVDANLVFSDLVEKGLYRIGRELTCPNCNMASWIPLDNIKQQVTCELCGQDYDASRQLVNGDWHYRRSGLLGMERNAQGAIPVVLTLQQLRFNFRMGSRDGVYFPSINLEPLEGTGLPSCEIDFAWLIPRPYPRKTVVIVGECKDQGLIDGRDIENMRRVADSFPRTRFKAFVLLAKLCPFTNDELDKAKSLNDKYRRRAILLTARELDPYHIYDRTKAEFKIDGFASTPEDLAQATSEIFFKTRDAEALGSDLDT